MTHAETTGVGEASDNGGADEVTESVVGPGAALWEARERLGLDVDEVARWLKVDARIVAALDEERYGELPTLVYTRGYVRRYAELVGLDADTLCVQLDALHRADPQIVRVSPSNRRVLVSGLLREHAGIFFGGVVSLVAVAIVASVWIASRSENDPVDDVPATSLFPREAPPALAEGEETTNPAAVDPAPTGQTAVADAPATTAQGNDVAEVDPLAGPAVVGDELGFLFSDDCWVEVRGGDGELLHRNLQRAGSTLTLSGDAPFVITLGYAPGVRLTYNGDPVALGPHTRNRKAELVLGH